MPISEKVRKSMAEGSWIRRMFEEGAVLKQRYGEENVFDLSLGNPVMEPPPELHQELKKLAEHNDIVMTCGAAGALNVVLKTILNQGDEVIIFAPYFVEYLNYVDNHGGVARILPADEQFMPKLDVLEANISAKTKAVIINSPNNPTGVVYREDLLHQLGEILNKKEAQYGTQIFLISDEAYRKIIYDGLKYPSPLRHHRQSIIATSHSKDLALPGERIGYIAIHPDCSRRDELVDGFIFCNRILGVAEYQRKRDFLYNHLTNVGYSVVKPQGAFYMFPKSPLEDDVAFVRELQQLKVLTVPGRGFGAPGHFRIAYCVDDQTLEGSIAGFKKAAQKFGPS